jgi:hypothetical protein
MSQHPKSMPEVAQLRTAPAIQGAILQRRSAGQSKRQIARDLGIARPTVDNVLAAHFQGEPDITIAETARKLIPKGLQIIDLALDEDAPIPLDTKAGIAMRYLENTLFRDTGKGNVTFNDAKLNVAIGLLPDPKPMLTVGEVSNNVTRVGDGDVTMLPTQPSQPGEVKVATEAAEKDGRATDTVASHTNFSQISPCSGSSDNRAPHASSGEVVGEIPARSFLLSDLSLADLEAEVARRKAHLIEVTP